MFLKIWNSPKANHQVVRCKKLDSCCWITFGRLKSLTWLDSHDGQLVCRILTWILSEWQKNVATTRERREPWQILAHRQVLREYMYTGLASNYIFLYVRDSIPEIKQPMTIEDDRDILVIRRTNRPVALDVEQTECNAVSKHTWFDLISDEKGMTHRDCQSST